MTKETTFTAAQEVLLAAAELAAQGKGEFTEWDLTVATWQRNIHRFGCRGYESQYPDHKRVMMEIMAGEKKKDNPLRRGWMEKTKKNHYRTTPLGQAEAERLTELKGEIKKTAKSAQYIYDAVIPYIESRTYRSHCEDPEEPRTWLGASSFFGLARNDPDHLNDRIRAATNAVETAQSWLKETSQNHFRQGVTGGGITIHREDLDRLEKLIDILQKRFKDQLSAIRDKKKSKIS